MPEFTVYWEIQVDADTHEEAARKALVTQRDPESIATVFDVHHPMPGVGSRKVDLSAIEEDERLIRKYDGN